MCPENYVVNVGKSKDAHSLQKPHKHNMEEYLRHPVTTLGAETKG